MKTNIYDNQRASEYSKLLAHEYRVDSSFRENRYIYTFPFYYIFCFVKDVNQIAVACKREKAT